VKVCVCTTATSVKAWFYRYATAVYYRVKKQVLREERTGEPRAKSEQPRVVNSTAIIISKSGQPTSFQV